jgi:hypothetical protein
VAGVPVPLEPIHQRRAVRELEIETDDLDVTYFLLFHLDVVNQALDDVQAYIRRKVRELRETRAILHPSSGLNHRQIALLRHALHRPDRVDRPIGRRSITGSIRHTCMVPTHKLEIEDPLSGHLHRSVGTPVSEQPAGVRAAQTEARWSRNHC